MALSKSRREREIEGAVIIKARLEDELWVRYEAHLAKPAFDEESRR
jgi:hypothetical protein